MSLSCVSKMVFLSSVSKIHVFDKGAEYLKGRILDMDGRSKQKEIKCGAETVFLLLPQDGTTS